METLSIRGAQLQLLPEKAAYLPTVEALLVSDVHLGKAETFQKLGIPVPNQVNEATLERLKQARDRTQARQLFILGDLFHAKAGMVDEIFDNWLRFLNDTQLEAHLILGNHDRPLLGSLSQLSVTCHTQPIQIHNWVLSHEPLTATNDINICGHIHPCVRLGGKQDRLRLPCFYWESTAQRLTLPSFGDFTGGHDVPISSTTIAYIVAENTVIPFNK